MGRTCVVIPPNKYIVLFKRSTGEDVSFINPPDIPAYYEGSTITKTFKSAETKSLYWKRGDSGSYVNRSIQISKISQGLYEFLYPIIGYDVENKYDSLDFNFF